MNSSRLWCKPSLRNPLISGSSINAKPPSPDKVKSSLAHPEPSAYLAATSTPKVSSSCVTAVVVPATVDALVTRSDSTRPQTCFGASHQRVLDSITPIQPSLPCSSSTTSTSDPVVDSILLLKNTVHHNTAGVLSGKIAYNHPFNSHQLLPMDRQNKHLWPHLPSALVKPHPTENVN